MIVLDIGNGIDENFQLLDHVYNGSTLPVLSDAVSHVQDWRSLKNLVRIWDFPQILEKTVRISPAFAIWSVRPCTCRIMQSS